jgi:predicted Fe-S protein YdhL (DUF1289 family)
MATPIPGQTPCAGCGRTKIRPDLWDPALRGQGKVRHGAGQLCVSCNDRRLRGNAGPARPAQRVPDETPCAGCGRTKIRPDLWDPALRAQGKVKHGGGQLCVSCQGRQCRGKPGPAAPAVRGPDESPCTGCGRTMIRKGLYQDARTTALRVVCRGSGTQCTSCYSRQRHGRSGPPRRRRTPPGSFPLSPDLVAALRRADPDYDQRSAACA